MAEQRELFRASTLPEGFEYRPDFLSEAEEAQLLDEIRMLPLEEAQYKEWRAKRRIVSYGGRYDFSEGNLSPAGPIPPFLHSLRERMAQWTGIAASDVHHAVIAEYRPGTQLGWHRDVPDFEDVMGVSLAGSARMRFRPYPPGRNRRTTVATELAPRSAYAIRQAARWSWQHAISPTKSLRYSITFRTLAQRHR